MEKQEVQDVPSTSKESTQLEESVEKKTNTTSVSVENDGVEKSAPSDEQMKMDESRQDTQKMEIERPETRVQSEMEVQPRGDQHLTVTTNPKIERRGAGAPEYFGNCIIPVFHKVEFTVSLSFGMYYKQFFSSSIFSIDKKPKTEVPIALGYYHTEFRLLPTDDEPVQIDIVPYYNFARVFTDKNETKTVKYHFDGRIHWVIWNQIFEVDITNDLLLQLFDFTIEINIWNSKEKLMSRTRFDKPRWIKIDIDEEDGKKQVNFQKEWLNQEQRNIFTPEENLKSPRRKAESLSNITVNDSELQLDSVKSKLSSITLAKPDPNQSNNLRRYSTHKDTPSTKVPIKLQYFFSDKCAITKQLEKSLDGLVDLLASVTLNKSLLSEEQKKQLNPMVITIHSVKDMPASSEENGADYSELKAKCQSVYLKYQLLHNKPYKSSGKPHQKEISFNDINVILTGNIDTMELREFFLGPGLIIEIHDRDRKPSKTAAEPLLFGDDLNDEKLSNIGVITSKKTKINPYKSLSPSPSFDPFGIARCDLSGFTLGQKFSYQELPILNSPVLDSLQNTEAENMNFAKNGNQNAGLFKPGQYISSSAMMNVTIKLTYAIIIPPVTNPRPPITPTYNCPFGRMVFRIAAERKTFLGDVLLAIAQINGRALGLNDVPDNILIATLLTLITTRHQRFDRLLDIITGFHIIDDTMHLLVVEGLQNHGIHTLINQFGDTDLHDVKILFNTDLICSHRLYASFDVILRKVKLHEPLETIVQQPLIYIRDMVPRLCYDALIQIYELSKCSKLIDAIRNNLYPTVNMVRSLSKEFGVVIKEEDLKIDASVACQDDSKLQVSGLDPPTEDLPDPENIKWKNIDHYNKPYLQLLKRNLHSAPANFITRNITLVSGASEKVKMKKESGKTVHLPQPLKDVHNYGMSTYNTVELKKLQLRQQMNPKSMYTYCPDFHHSMTFAPIELEELYKNEELQKKRKWRTHDGWACPGFKSSVESYIHPKRPSQGRIKELAQPYEETLKINGADPRERCAFTWSERVMDMNIWSRPSTDPCEKVHVLQCPVDQEDKAVENWKSKMVVKNARTRFHRQLTETELQMQGRRASCQLDKMKGLLKDKPVRKAFKYRPVADIPPLDVVNYPELCVNSSERKLLKSYEGNGQKNGYGPGPYWPERSLSLFGNHTMMHDYEHQIFVNSKGEDFRCLHTPHHSVYKRKHHVTPVNEEEKLTPYDNLKNCFCPSHTAPEDWRRQLYHCSPGPPYTTSDTNMETTINNTSQKTRCKNMTESKSESSQQMDH